MFALTHGLPLTRRRYATSPWRNTCQEYMRELPTHSAQCTLAPSVMQIEIAPCERYAGAGWAAASSAGTGACSCSTTTGSLDAAATNSDVAVAVAWLAPFGARLLLKHCRQSTGRPCVGLNGTVVTMPHSEHSVRVSVRESPAAAGPEPAAFVVCPLRLDLHGLQRFGSFLNCLSRKKSCSPAVKMNSPPQSAQVKSRSTKSMPLLPLSGKVDPSQAPRKPRMQTPGRTFVMQLRGAHVAEVATSGLPATRLSLKRLNRGLPTWGVGSAWRLRRDRRLQSGARRPSLG
jgi:hypothetical protein